MYEKYDLNDKRHLMDRKCMDDCFYGTATVGQRGQIVIPAEAREELGISPGDKILIMRHPAMKGLMMTKFDSMQEFLDLMKKSLDQAVETPLPGEEE
jgi:AbrB family looped-hinge helix DNA binding protein